MRLKVQLNLLAVSVIFAVALFVSIAALFTIDRLSNELLEQRMKSEVSWILGTFKAANKTLHDAGVDSLSAYVELAQKDLMTEFRNFQVGDSGRLYIISEKGRVISAAHDRALADITPTTIGLIPKQGSGIARAPVAGENAIIYYDTYPDWNMTILLSVSEREINANRDHFLFVVVLILSFSVVTGIFIFAWYANRFVKPILALAQQLSSVTEETMGDALYVKNSSSEVAALFSSFRDMSRRLSAANERRQKAEAELWQQANYDALTGLANRRMFLDRLQIEIRQCARNGKEMALLFLDLDNFKDVNDTLGHDQGDILLVEAAARLRKCVRDVDTLARLGGDEFTIILSGLGDRRGVERVAEDILQRLSESFQLGLETVFVSTSIGIAIYPDDSVLADTLLKNADQAMYSAKKHGRNCFEYFRPKLQEAAQQRMQLIRDLHNAIAENQFLLHYQPIIDLQTGGIFKAEALIRWQHPERGLISPAVFIPLAEETGLINAIGDWVFHEATRQTVAWRQSLCADLQISINTSPVQFQQKGSNLFLWFEHLRSIGLPCKALVVEITESLFMENDGDAHQTISVFHDAGVEIALDDFGTGYSSLSYLNRFDLDYLKIDQSFVRHMRADSRELALCQAIIVMAHKLGMKVIAEGVETLLQRDLLVAAGCDYGQGYLFSKPVPSDDFARLITS